MIEKNLAKLVSYKTLSENHKVNKRAIKWIRSQMRDLPFYYQSFSSNNFPSFIATTQKTKNPKLWLYAHLDVVDGKESQFKLKKRKSRYIGRGVFDMKFAIACYLKLFSEIKDELKKMNLGLMITTDEEVAGYNGAGYIMSRGYGGEACFLPDGGENWKFEKASKGICYCLVECSGDTSHGSQPWNGQNAVQEMMDFLCALRKKFPSEPCGEDEHFHNTISVGKIEGGDTVNQVPDSAYAMVDIRMTPDTEKKEIEEILESEAKDFREVKVKPVVFANAQLSDLNGQYFRIFRRIAKEKFGIKTGSINAHGSSDARFFGEKNIPTISIRPRGGGQHADDEWISARDLERFYQVLKEFVLKAA